MDLIDKIAALLHHAGRTPADVIWMGTQGPRGFRQTWAEFAARAPVGVDYNILDVNMVIVGDDWWIEYDREFGDFEYYRFPLMPDAPRTWTLDLRGDVVDQP